MRPCSLLRFVAIVIVFLLLQFSLLYFATHVFLNDCPCTRYPSKCLAYGAPVHSSSSNYTVLVLATVLPPRLFLPFSRVLSNSRFSFRGISRPEPLVFSNLLSGFLGRSSGFHDLTPCFFPDRPSGVFLALPDPRVFSARPSSLLGQTLGFSRPGPPVFIILSLGVSSGFPRHNSLFFVVCSAVVWPSLSLASIFLQPRASLW